VYAPAGMAQLNQIRSLQALAGLLNTQYAVPLGQYCSTQSHYLTSTQA
jgi:hypothetical protein